MIKDTINTTPKVSVIIPLNNKAPYITKALDSVKAQTFADYECLIINDGSTDNSEAIVQSWLAQHSQYTIHFTLYTQENAGVSAARNHGISLSTGDYVAFLDADDWWAPEFLQEMVKFAEEYPEAGLYASNYIYYKPGKTRIGCLTPIPSPGDEGDWIDRGYINYPKSYYDNKGQVVWTGAVMIRRLKIEDCRLDNGEVFPVGITIGEDFLLWARIALQYKVAFLNKPLAYYNNDVPAKLRLTQNLHKPAAHMLWHMDRIEEEGLRTEEGADWKRLLDWLRVSGLLAYWMSDSYHGLAAKELAKVDGELPRVYRLPIGWLRFKSYILTIASSAKQMIIHLK